MSAPVVAAPSSSVPAASLADRVRAVIDQIRPAVQADGGDVEFVNVDEASQTARVRFRGSCIGCPSLPLTLQTGIERAVRKQVPEIVKVVAVP
jgi:Fe-S cluster biogenesis protein NfuA